MMCDDMRYMIKVYTTADILVNCLDKPVIFKFKCDICGERFKYQSDMSAHNSIYHYYIDIHNRTYRCVICNKPYRMKRNMINHMFVHHDDSSDNNGSGNCNTDGNINTNINVSML